SQTYDHIVAERKRREQLSQRFVALSTIVPGLKKMDKTSVLGDAIKYLKHLQERVKTLEEQSTKQTMESVVLVKKSQIMAEDEGSSDESDELPLPEIEARVCNSQILLRVHCERQKGVLVNLLGKVEKLNLAVVNTNVTPFGSLALDITIVAEVFFIFLVYSITTKYSKIYLHLINVICT
ncbi:transcription factor bhlh25, partial [Phtheirospermum japonicum]